MTYESKNGTGTGMIAMGVRTIDGIPIGDTELSFPQAPGTYSVKWTGEVAPDPDCDPTRGPCEMWYPGNYTVIVGK